MLFLGKVPTIRRIEDMLMQYPGSLSVHDKDSEASYKNNSMLLHMLTISDTWKHYLLRENNTLINFLRDTDKQ